MLPRGLAPKTGLLLTVSVLGLSPGTARAQGADSLASISSELFPASRDANDPNRAIVLHVLRVNAMLPVPVASKTLLLPGLKYEYTNVLVSGTESNIPAPMLITAQLSLGLVQELVAGLSFVGNLSVGCASDFSQGISTGDLVFTGTAIVLYRFGPSLSVGVGISYDRRTGTPTPLPAVLLNWRPTASFRIRGFVPARLDVELRLVRWFTVGGFAMFNGDRYALGENRYGQKDMQIAFSTAEAGPKVTFSLSDWLHIDLGVGVPVYRRYDVYVGGNQTNGAALDMVPAYGVKFRVGPSQWDDDPRATAPTSPGPS